MTSRSSDQRRDRESVPSDVDQPILNYAAHCASAVTVNQLNAVHTDLERRLTPVERHALVTEWKRKNWWKAWFMARLARSCFDSAMARLSADWRPHSARVRPGPVVLDSRSRRAIQYDWISGLSQAIRAVPSTRPAPFRRALDSGGLQLFRLGEEPSPSVLVAFTGKAGRLMMALADFLQHAEILGVDIAVVSLPDRRLTYWDGIPGHDEDLESLISRMSHTFSGYDLRQSSVMGTSLGSVPALIAGAVWGARKVVAVGTFRPPADVWLGPLASAFANEPRPVVTDSATHFLFVYGQESRVDAEVAHEWAALLNGHTEAVEGAWHNPLYPLLQRGQLPAWLVRSFA